jgi:recombination protein RecR
MALRLLGDRGGLLRELVSALQEAAAGTRFCPQCGSLTSADAGPCRLCNNPSRDGAVLCVVEEPGDVVSIERSGGYTGRYHCLMGRLSPMRGDGPGDLRVRALIERVERDRFREVVLALSTDVEGDATASYLADRLTARGVRVTRLAHGLPAGSAVAYSDPVTLARAMRGRVAAGGGA